jgi:hypothetical protein
LICWLFGDLWLVWWILNGGLLLITYLVYTFAFWIDGKVYRIDVFWFDTLLINFVVA